MPAVSKLAITVPAATCAPESTFTFVTRPGIPKANPIDSDAFTVAVELTCAIMGARTAVAYVFGGYPSVDQ